MTYKVGAPIPITGIQFGMRVEFGYDCLIPADFNNDVSLNTQYGLKISKRVLEERKHLLLAPHGVRHGCEFIRDIEAHISKRIFFLGLVLGLGLGLGFPFAVTKG